MLDPEVIGCGFVRVVSRSIGLVVYTGFMIRDSDVLSGI